MFRTNIAAEVSQGVSDNLDTFVKVPMSEGL